jgi:alpha-N-arabinofuranosidase
MDRYDPEKRVGLIVDEWGVWHNVEPGSNPGFLYQQNTMRDALVAGITLNIFNEHCERVHMANLAQTINVLQALILTEGEQMLLTPTYHVFELYQVHQDAALLETRVANEAGYLHKGERLPQVHVSASKDETGQIHVSLCNLDPQAGAEVEVNFAGVEAIEQATGRTVTAEAMNAHNSFSESEKVKTAEFHSFSVAGQTLTARLAPMSVTVLEVADSSD